MAADLKPDWLSCLPSSWSYGVTRDGRIFFINEEAKSTTWLHPVTGEAVITGHRKTPDLPTGWEEGYTFEGARCFINFQCCTAWLTPIPSASPSVDSEISSSPSPPDCSGRKRIQQNYFRSSVGSHIHTHKQSLCMQSVISLLPHLCFMLLG
ncbi:pleckstrin homology domain-containing family A member 7-like isoform X1 [Micropterus dolomieu]|uniref:pleckstrin homology domain-containing family A member 7-like isoform X1 n=1 Tax=Micropterus dolomieu TaxID=147949 RepID=UPI001E8CBEB8|nr:pleckstrin homology domain-containing family A member 7-like isoform X1 [Micropterus dolomieu]